MDFPLRSFVVPHPRHFGDNVRARDVPVLERLWQSAGHSLSFLATKYFLRALRQPRRARKAFVGTGQGL